MHQNSIQSLETDNKIIYTDGEIELKLSDHKDTIWANINNIAALFSIDRSVVSKHIKNIFKDNELDEKWYVQILHTPQNNFPSTLLNTTLNTAQ